MAKPLFQGVYTAIITPFTNSGKIDWKAYGNLLDEQLEARVSGIVPCGTTGESPTTSHKEDNDLIDFTIRRLKGRAQVIPGTGSNSTEEAIQSTKYAQIAGADVVMLVNPYYNKPTQKGLYLHFKAIADSVRIPCIIYNIKGRTGVNVETPTLIRLMKDCKNILGVKEASGDIRQMKDVLRLRNPNFSVLSGDDNMTLELIKAGGDGVISVASNIVPKEIVRMVDFALKGRTTEAKKIDERLAVLLKTLFIETNPIPIKTALSMQGKCKERFRLPMCTMEGANKKMLRSILKKMSLI